MLSVSAAERVQTSAPGCGQNEPTGWEQTEFGKQSREGIRKGERDKKSGRGRTKEKRHETSGTVAPRLNSRREFFRCGKLAAAQLGKPSAKAPRTLFCSHMSAFRPYTGRNAERGHLSQSVIAVAHGRFPDCGARCLPRTLGRTQDPAVISCLCMKTPASVCEVPLLRYQASRRRVRSR